MALYTVDCGDRSAGADVRGVWGGCYGRSFPVVGGDVFWYGKTSMSSVAIGIFGVTFFVLIGVVSFGGCYYAMRTRKR